MLKSVRTPDQYLLRYRVWMPPPSTEMRGILVLLNGIMSHSGWFEPISGLLCGHGFKLVGADRRGSGENMEQRGDAPAAQTLLDDLSCIIQAEQIENTESPVHLVGWCWGAVLAINAAYQLPEKFTTISLLAPGLFPTAALQNKIQAERIRHAAQVLDVACMENPIREEMFTRGPALDNFIRKDHLRLCRFTPRFMNIMTKMAMTAHIRLPRLKLPLSMILAEYDEATDNSTALKIFERIPQKHKHTTTLPSAHGLQFEAPQPLAQAIADFVSRSNSEVNHVCDP